MKCKIVFTVLTTGIIFICTSAVVESMDRSEKSLSFRQHTDGLNIEHIISLWNKSVSEETHWPAQTTTTTTITQPTSLPSTSSATTTAIPTTSTTSHKLPLKPPEGFVERFDYCIRRHGMNRVEIPEQKLVIKCLKAALITKLHKLLANPAESIKFFNGYLEFQKLVNPQRKESVPPKKVLSENGSGKKKYSSRVSSKKTDSAENSEPLVPVPLKQPKGSQSHSNDYYESYQKMLRELVARKSGAELSRQKREEEVLKSKTLEKSARFFESGRKLVSEISNNLENDQQHVETLTQTILDPELVSTLNNFTKAYSLRLNFYPGVAARMTRNDNSGVTFDLELDDLNEVEEDDSSKEDDGGREKKKKKKKKISKKTLKKLFPYLLIPFMIQAALLPIVLKFLLFVAIKALIAGKLALILVAFNAIRNASLKSDEDEYIERMGYEHYGYGQGEEYGAWVNRRTIDGEGRDHGDHGEQQLFAQPYSHYEPSKETQEK